MSRVEKVEAYRASDGALFPSTQQCQEHEVSLVWRARIAEFMASTFCPYTTGTPAGISPKIIVAWEQFKEAHKGDAAVDMDEKRLKPSKTEARRNSAAPRA